MIWGDPGEGTGMLLIPKCSIDYLRPTMTDRVMFEKQTFQNLKIFTNEWISYKINPQAHVQFDLTLSFLSIPSVFVRHSLADPTIISESVSK